MVDKRPRGLGQVRVDGEVYCERVAWFENQQQSHENVKLLNRSTTGKKCRKRVSR